MEQERRLPCTDILCTGSVYKTQVRRVLPSAARKRVVFRSKEKHKPEDIFAGPSNMGLRFMTRAKASKEGVTIR